MTVQLGSFRFDRSRHVPYIVCFSDSAGLAKKADVKIAGVKVGWVDDVVLDETGRHVHATVMILHQYHIYADAKAMVRQDGLLGSKYIELSVGDPRLSVLVPGAQLAEFGKQPVAVEDLLGEMQCVAQNLNAIAGSFKEVFGGQEGAQRLCAMVQQVNEATQSISDFSVTLQQGVEHITHAVDHSFNRVAQDFERAAQPLEEVVAKINDGKGLIGKLVHDDEIYNDIKYATQGIKAYITKVDDLAVIFDMHSESLHSIQNCCFDNAKGYFNVRMHPVEDYFYLVGILGSEYGILSRQEKIIQRCDCEGTCFNPESSSLTPAEQQLFAPKKRKLTHEFDALLFNLQLGKIYNNFALRGGVFESTFGVAVDYDFPIHHDYVRFVTTFEIFDFHGRNRIDDDRPHLKLLNRFFISHTLYCDFGFDDFISKRNKTFFFGAGLRFADDDVKYFASAFSFNR